MLALTLSISLVGLGATCDILERLSYLLSVWSRSSGLSFGIEDLFPSDSNSSPHPRFDPRN